MTFRTRMVSSSSHPPAVVLSLVLMIFMAVSLPSISSSSRQRFVAETILLSASMDETSDRGGGGRDSAVSSAREVREVPTGPNPLHHNHKPITKPRKDRIITHP